MVRCTAQQAFNRTSLELKLNMHQRGTEFVFTFNRTSLELKLSLEKVIRKLLETFNRTSLELKLRKPHQVHA